MADISGFAPNDVFVTARLSARDDLLLVDSVYAGESLAMAH